MFRGEARDMLDEFPKEDEEIYRDDEGTLHVNIGIQFEFQCPAYLRCGKELQVPSRDDEDGLCPILTAQVAAFAQEIIVFDSLEDYEAYNKKRKEEDENVALWADKSFSYIPKNKQVDDPNPTPECCMFTGHVLQAEERINEHTGELYYWAFVETVDDVKFDVVIHPDLVDHQRPPRVGCIVQGVYFLSAHFFPDKDE